MPPYYLIEEDLLRRNLALIKSIADRAGVEFILAFKAFALWKTFPIFREYISHTTASSPYEARLAFEEFGSKAHTYSPAYEEDTFEEIVKYCRHISINSRPPRAICPFRAARLGGRRVVRLAHQSRIQRDRD